MSSDEYIVLGFGICSPQVILQSHSCHHSSFDLVIAVKFSYVEDFENGDGGWTVQGSSSWELGIPDNVIINTSEFGNSSWVTNLNGTYFSNEFGWIESPSFDLTPLNEPYLKMSLWWDTTTNDGHHWC